MQRTRVAGPTDIREIERRKAKEVEQAEHRKELARSDLRHVMRDEQGRRFVWSLLQKLGEDGKVWDDNGLRMARRATHADLERSLSKRLWSSCEQEYLRMRKENDG